MTSAWNLNQTPARTRHALTMRIVGVTLAGLLLLAAFPPHAEAAATLPPLGMSMESVNALKSAGAAPRYGSFWVGPWTASSGWGGLDSALRTAKATGTTPVIHWYYWGDSISPNCVNNGCDGRTRAQWMSMTDTLANHVRNEMGGRETIIVLENEFNKNGISGTYAGTFDSHLETVAKKLRAVGGVKLVIGYGAWGEGEWYKFPKTLAQSEFVGFQLMRASTKDSESAYRGAADRINYLSGFASSKFGKPAFLYDLALSSYPDAKWERIQADTLNSIFKNLKTSGTGLRGVVYRTLYDNPSMDPKNYYGYAEKHWGLKKANNGGDKPAWGVWKAYATGGSAPPSSPPPSGGGTFTATFNGVKVDEWWVQTSVSASKSISKVEARVNGGAWEYLGKQSWGGYAKSIHVTGGQTVEFKATATDGSTAMSGKYARGGGSVGAPPAGGGDSGGSFSATLSGVKVDEWWVQTSVSANKGISKVEARVDGGAWQYLGKQSWGGYAKSIHVVGGQSVDFKVTATDGSSWTSGKYARGGGGGGTAPAPAPSGFDANFNGVKVDEWWVQTSVTANKGISKVEARVNGGAWQYLGKQSWGGYAKSIHVLGGQHVEFKVTATDGSTDMSGKYYR